MPSIAEIDSLKREVESLKESSAKDQGRLEQMKKEGLGDLPTLEKKIERLQSNLEIKKKKYSQLLKEFQIAHDS